MPEEISWRSLPNIPRIMVEFSEGRSEVISLLGGDWRNESERSYAAKRRLKQQSRRDLGHIVREGYGYLALPQKVKDNINALDDENTLAVVTGQQVGIFGGPLYTIYKALTAIKLAETLGKKTPGTVVPIFWMETGDADFNEINHISFPSVTENVRRAVYLPGGIIARRSISSHSLKPEITEVASEISSWLGESKFGAELTELIRDAYQPGRPIAAAFRQLLHSLLGEEGLVIVDPQHPSMIVAAKEFWGLCLENSDRLNGAFSASSREITDLRLPLQVRLRTDTLPFMHEDSDGFRQRVYSREGELTIGKNGPTVSIEDLKQSAIKSTGDLTPSALLRPLLQDWLIPTWIYVAGPAEVAYLAQTGRCYDLLNIPRPLIATRMSVTLVGKKERRLLDRHQWRVVDVIGGRELLLHSHGRDETLADFFDSGADQLTGWLKRLERLGDESNVNITREVDQAGRKLNYQWDKLRRLTMNKIAERDKVRTAHADNLLESLMPDGMMQERHDNILYYLAAHGRGFFKLLESEVNLFKPQHLAIDLEAIE